MAQELIYTSSPKGLKPASRGFCTVAASAGISPQSVALMESLSGYRHVHVPTESAKRHPDNPVAWSHLITSTGVSLLSRVADAGLDYSGRNNKIAHHRLLDPSERSKAGPVAMMVTNPFCEHWIEEPRLLGQSQLAPGDSQPVQTESEAEPNHRIETCPHWASTSVGAEGAHRLAATAESQQEAFVIYQTPLDVLAMVQEAMELLPPAIRWRTTFSTYFTALPPGVTCQWRFVLAETKEARRIPPHDRIVKIDLTNKQAPF